MAEPGFKSRSLISSLLLHNYASRVLDTVSGKKKKSADNKNPCHRLVFIQLSMQRIFIEQLCQHARHFSRIQQ